jgi:hypothetical protein
MVDTIYEYKFAILSKKQKNLYAITLSKEDMIKEFQGQSIDPSEDTTLVN